MSKQVELDSAIQSAIEDVRLGQSHAFRLEDHCFPEQLAFILDKARNKTAVCSRRAGKTEGCAADLIDTALRNHGSVCLYITLKRNNAKKLIWPVLLRINREYDLGGEPNTTDLSLTFPNASIIYCSGAKDASEIENFRGMALKKVYVDECQSFRQYIRDLVDDVLSKTLFDYNGTLCLTGTPGPIEAGYFWEASQSKNWSHHFWTMFQNPWLKKKSGRDVMDLVQEDMARMGVDINHPKIQRECFGRWVTDTESLLIHYSPDKNHYDNLPAGTYNYILGIDIGFEDADALVILAWSESRAESYIVEEVVTKQQGITELVEQVEVLRKRYEISKIVMDYGGLGKKIGEEINRRHHIPVKAADKVRKMENVAFLNAALRTGKLKARRDSKFAQDSYLVEVDQDKSTPDKIKVSDRYHSDIIDAVLYAFKESPAFTYQPPKVTLKAGTPEYAAQEATNMEEAAEEHFRKLEDEGNGNSYY